MAEIEKLMKLIESNPQVDMKQLAEFAELLRKLHEAGIEGRKYRLASPVERRHVVVGENERSDPRTIHLNIRH